MTYSIFAKKLGLRSKINQAARRKVENDFGIELPPTRRDKLGTLIPTHNQMGLLEFQLDNPQVQLFNFAQQTTQYQQEIEEGKQLERIAFYIHESGFDLMSMKDHFSLLKHLVFHGIESNKIKSILQFLKDISIKQ
ncbi:UNKNOWN [Stylonychia lemnae]|uniref:Uncharacterized protein n=1 Tax=Stylonychia lemnae TaxID=5949 RepID=A0A078A134_STYLE|nr:UNKNOWN [Stylonychia lemnae]|eukprot:CDW75941.1 UNKNOWN [Stylonychia lemnae]